MLLLEVNARESNALCKKTQVQRAEQHPFTGRDHVRRSLGTHFTTTNDDELEFSKNDEDSLNRVPNALVGVTIAITK